MAKGPFNLRMTPSGKGWRLTRRREITRQLSELSRDGWARAIPADYESLERELQTLTTENDNG